MPKPSFFIVGAPKCGTTAMCKYLNRHPEIYIPPIKEIKYFDTDFKWKIKAKNLEEYLAFFDDGLGKICGEGSPSYFYSKQAATEIYNFNPDAKIIIMLREPVSLLYSYHSQKLFNGSSEDIQDFREALEAEPERRLGKRIPKKCKSANQLFYTDVVKFTENIQRYFDKFGRERVHIIIYDDFIADLPKVYEKTLKFLEVDSTFQTEFNRINSNKKVRNVALQQLLKYPPAKILEFGKFLLPLPRSMRQSILERVKSSLKSFNTQKVKRPPLDPEYRRSLQKKFAPEIEKLSILLERDLTHWSQSSDNLY
ncbi:MULTISPECIES: sulfotransferase [unclassified Okeania]|uniref:sulfotransferase family protein n=1 Tax=unclassified Okeania TaxID=2634635 RepID=UPI0013BB8F97|nr:MULTISPECIES: sulfotransferase [unclassified Okeania]NET12495.1 sulfotransferase [Okeania sp. SIO1H6]NES76458.1 sulfotransferase [Okeania sp. SIO1H4]NET22466.1 sulfotransferase [Okeania sp. SIO1H5]NET79403.1 sulfotransferase [Okeania sp. SIO1F9]NET95929.1 sulfotransferase [Okeania sp. SIO1H2]